MKEVFTIIAKKLSGIKYALIGTSNIMMQGGNVYPDDVDFLTDDENIQKISKIFSSKIVNDSGYRETEIQLANHDVHFVSASTNPLRNDDLSGIIRVDKWGIEIPCMTLESELSFYKKIDSGKAKKKVKMIEDLIKNKK